MGLIQDMEKNVRDRIRSNLSEQTDETVLELIEELVLHDEAISHISIREKTAMIDTIFYKTRKDLSILEPYARDSSVSEIMVNGKDSVFIEQNGRINKMDKSFDSTEELEEVIRRIGAKIHREINELNPIMDARLDDGSRVNAVYKNIALNGPILTIRKFPKTRITMADLIDYGTITEEASGFLQKLVKGAYNIFISGGTSSGKTTFLNILSNYIPENERIITIEDSAELQVTAVDNIVRLECKNANIQGKGEVNMQNLIRSSLRMRPNRIIVGEVRGAEVLDMIQAMNTGHDGSLSTGHGNSPKGMLNRLEAMFLQAADFPVEAIRSQIYEAIDIIVHLGMIPGRKRVVLEIAELTGIHDSEIQLNILYAYDRKNGLTKKKELINTKKLEMRGISI